MSRTLVSVVVTVLCALWAMNANAQLPPPNDACANATVISNGTSGGTTVGATADGSSTCDFPAGGVIPDVWYSYTATCTGTVTVYTCNVTDWDPILSVHPDPPGPATGCPGTTANQIVCNDQADPAPCNEQFLFDARVTFAATQGTTYRIRVAARSPSPPCSPATPCTGPITLVVVPPLNAPLVNNIPNTSVACGSDYTGPTPALTNPGCMTPVTWSIVTAPPGSTINASTGVIEVLPQPIGNFGITIRATNATGSDDEAWTVTVNRIAPVVNDVPDDTTDESVPYAATPTLTTPGCMDPVTWSLITGPAGMTIDASSGNVSWPSPSVAGSPHTVTTRATNSAGSDDETWILTVRPIGPGGGFYWRSFFFDPPPAWPPAPSEGGQQNRPTSDPVWTQTQVLPPAPPATTGPIQTGRLTLSGLPGSRHQWNVTVIIPDEPAAAPKTVSYRFTITGSEPGLTTDSFVSWSAGHGNVGENVFDTGIFHVPSQGFVFPVNRGPFILNPKPEQEWFVFTLHVPTGAGNFVAIDDFFFSAVCEGTVTPLPGYPPLAVATVIWLLVLAFVLWHRLRPTSS